MNKYVISLAVLLLLNIAFLKAMDAPQLPAPSPQKSQCVYCLICQRIFKNFGGLRLHMPTHDMTRPFKCTICTEGFVSNTGLLVHKGTKDHKTNEAYAQKDPATLAAAELLLELSKKQD